MTSARGQALGARGAGFEGGLKVLIADDHHLVREGMGLVLQEIDEHISVVEASTLAEAIEQCQKVPDIDLVLLDLSMPGADGVSGLDAFERYCPSARIVVISATYDAETVQAVLHKGALGFIPKIASKNVLLGALRFVLSGGIYVPPEAVAGLRGPQGVMKIESSQASAAAARSRPDADNFGLTNRQLDVLRELLEGKSNKQICRDLNLAMGTVKVHVAAVLHALGANSRAEAIAAVQKLGWQPGVRN